MKKRYLFIGFFVASTLTTVALTGLLVNIFEKKRESAQYPRRIVDIPKDEIDPSVWGKNFPHQYDMFIKTQEDYGRTPYGGSTVYSKLEAYPAMKRLWAGYAFSIDHNEERGHHYAQIDQQNTQRVKVISQPGACINCHAAETPKLIREMGWETFNRTPYNDLKDKLRYGSSCSDCHDPETMDLTITRPAFREAMEMRGIDLDKATRQEMRSYVCAQCHVEYYFKGPDKLLTFPWNNGYTVENIEEYYDKSGFTDFTHKETGASMIKIQHPEFELWSTGIHARSGVSCADCHMPYTRVGGIKVSDHWMRSPLHNLNQSCQTCHNRPENELRNRVLEIQKKTAELLRRCEEALIAAIDAIVEAKKIGVTDVQLAKALKLHRSSQLRWDFVSSENSTGFHSPQEAARILAVSVDLARQAELEAWKGMMTIRVR